MRATELKAKLQSDLSAKQGQAAKLRAERVNLALPANSGDAEAALRLVDLRSDLRELEAEIAELEQALADVAPLVEVQQTTERLMAREGLYEQFGARRAEVAKAVKALDAEIVRVGQAFRDVERTVAALTPVAIELLVPMTSGSDVGQVAQSRMVANISLSLPDLAELFAAAAGRARTTGAKPLSIAEAFAVVLKSIDRRLLDVIERDRATAARAGVVPEPEPA